MSGLGAAPRAWKTAMTQSEKTSRPSFEDAGRKLEEAARRMEQETEKFIRYLNDEVIPEVREHSSRGLRRASKELAKFADYLDETQKKGR
jgi:acyl-CoA reductase-like NAD-dependent aldehyde dehydrogenase